MVERNETPTPEEILTAEHGWLRALALSLARDPDRADDVVQDAAMRMLERPPTSMGAARAWLRRVVRNRVSDLRRGEGRRAHREQAVAGDGMSPSAAEQAAAAEIRARVRLAALALDEPYLTTVRLAYYSDLSIAEIAARTDVPYETARARLRRGLARLRGTLDREFGSRSAWAHPVLASAGSGSGEGGASGAARVRPARRPVGGSRWRPHARWGVALAVTALIGWTAVSAIRAHGPTSANAPAVTTRAGPDARSSPRQRVVRATDASTVSETAPREATPVAVTDAGVEPVPPPVEPAPPTRAVRGRIVFPDDAPSHGLQVSLVVPDKESSWRRVPARIGSAGRFEIPSVAADLLTDPLKIEVAADGFLTTSYRVPFAERERVEIAPAREIVLSGRLIDARGEPVAGARLSGWHGALNQSVATTGDDGRYRFAWRSDAAHPVEVYVERADHQEGERITLAHAVTGDMEIPDIALSAREPIVGRVLSADGSPRGSVAVHLFGENSRGQARPAVETDAEGGFRFPAVGPGLWEVEATWTVGEGEHAVVHGGRARRLRAGERDVRLVGAPIHEITIRLVNGTDGSPFSHPRVLTYVGYDGKVGEATGPAYSTRLHLTGKPEIRIWVPSPGGYDLAVATFDHPLVWKRGLQVSPDEPLTVEFRLGGDSSRR